MKVERLSREADILGRNNIETYEELRAHYGKIHDRCETLEKERKQLRVDKRRMSEEEAKPVTSVPSVDATASAITQVWTYVGELLFNMLVLVGTIKLSDQVVQKMIGV